MTVGHRLHLLVPYTTNIWSQDDFAGAASICACTSADCFSSEFFSWEVAGDTLVEGDVSGAGGVGGADGVAALTCLLRMMLSRKSAASSNPSILDNWDWKYSTSRTMLLEC